MLVLLLLILLAAITPASAQPKEVSNPNQMLLDAIYVPCSDSTEALYVFQDGRVIYAAGDQGTFFSISGPLLNDLRTTTINAETSVDKKGLDSCTTIGVILEGQRYILINNSRPTEDTKNLQGRLERIRKYAQRKLARAMERLTDQAAIAVDSAHAQPSLPPGEFRRHVRLSPIAHEWRCRGTITIAVKIGANGDVRDAFIRSSKVRGKCTSLLAVAALRAAMLTRFEPATNDEGKQTSGWIFIEIPFTTNR